MKKFNCLNSVAIIVILIAVVDASAMQCTDQNKSNSSRKADLERKIFGGWMGLSVGSFVGEEIFHHLSGKYPVKKEHYLKYARYSRQFSRFAALPVISFMTCLAMRAASTQFPEESAAQKSLVVTTEVSALPFKMMVVKPAQAYEYSRYQQKINAEKTSQ